MLLSDVIIIFILYCYAIDLFISYYNEKYKLHKICHVLEHVRMLQKPFKVLARFVNIPKHIFVWLSDILNGTIDMWILMINRLVK